MSSTTSEPTSSSVAWLYDARIRAILYQLITIGIFVAFIYWIVNNTLDNLEARGIATGFTFLGHPAGFGLPFHLVPYTETSTYATAFLVGVLNTIFVSAIAIVLATFIGFSLGIMRLSSNFVVSRLAQVYLESIRNVPLLLQILFWYFGVLSALPRVKESYAFFNESLFLNNRGFSMPRLLPEDGSMMILYAVIIGIVAAIAVKVWAKKRQDATGQQFPVFFVSVALIVGLPLLAFFASGMPFGVEHVAKTRFGLSQGWTIVPEFMALLVALTMYHAAFIGEIVRAGILSVSHGQSEAAHALGVRNGPTLKLVIIPQAMRVIIPPLTSMYLNITKNSSLAPAIGYPELVAVWAGTVLNQTGQAIECMAMTMGVYLAISLIISGFMNWYNKRISLVER